MLEAEILETVAGLASLRLQAQPQEGEYQRLQGACTADLGALVYRVKYLHKRLLGRVERLDRGQRASDQDLRTVGSEALSARVWGPPTVRGGVVRARTLYAQYLEAVVRERAQAQSLPKTDIDRG